MFYLNIFTIFSIIVIEVRVGADGGGSEEDLEGEEIDSEEADGEEMDDEDLDEVDEVPVSL